MNIEEQIWEQVLKVRGMSPLVHSITNYVVMNNTANALLAAGASPLMAHARSELKEIVALAGALVINIGTLDENWVASMLRAAAEAQGRKVWVLDPVGAGASSYRNQVLKDLLAFRPSVIRGNASEILALNAGIKSSGTKGVDSTHGVSEAQHAARILSETVGSVVCVSGKEDLIVWGEQTLVVDNGHEMMTRVTGLGCSASALCGAFAAVAPDKLFLATGAAMSLIGVCGQLAAARSAGPGSLQMKLLDTLYNIEKEEFLNTLKVRNA